VLLNGEVIGNVGMWESEDNFRELMAGQLGIWNAQQLDPGNPIYNIGE
jgi:hypothetical protein